MIELAHLNERVRMKLFRRSGLYWLVRDSDEGRHGLLASTRYAFGLPHNATPKNHWLMALLVSWAREELQRRKVL